MMRRFLIIPVVGLVLVGCSGGSADPPTGTSASSSSTSTAASLPASTTTTTSVPATTSTTTSTTSTSTTTTTTTTTVPVAVGAMQLWDTVWQIAAKADEAAMVEYVDRLAAARGSAGQSVTGFWFSVVNINQDIATPNGFGHQFGSFTDPNPEYLDDVERLIQLAYDRELRVGIVVAWDGPRQYSVEQGKLTFENAYAYGNRIASQWTRPDLAARASIGAWIMGGDTTDDCCNGEHGEVWSEVVRGIRDAEAANGYPESPVLFHTAPGQHLHYLGADWLDGHAPQTGHCNDAEKASAWMQELFAADGRSAPVWGNGEMRYEDIQWECNDFQPITPEQVLADAGAMANLVFIENFVYGYDPRWNSSRPGEVGMSAAGVAAGLQSILDEPGLIGTRLPLPET